MTGLRDHLEKLHAFAAVCRHGSISAAAAEIRITQPALTTAIHVLEGAIGVKLLVRSARGVAPTASGTELFEYCKEFFPTLQALEDRIRSPGDRMAGNLRIGTFQSLAARFWPKLLKRMSARYPALKISMRNDSSAGMSSLLLAGHIDLMVSLPPPPHPSFRTRTLFRERLGFYVSRRFPIRSCSREAILKQLLILVPDAEISPGNTLLRNLWQHGINPTWTYELETFEAALEYAIEGVGVAVLPTHVAKAAERAGRLRELSVTGVSGASFCAHEIAASYRAEDANNPLLLAVLLEMGAK